MANLKKLIDFGQSAWLDFIKRDLLESGKLKSMVNDGVRGVTSNPAIFKKAIAAEESRKSLLRNNSFASLIINSKSSLAKIGEICSTDIVIRFALSLEIEA